MYDGVGRSENICLRGERRSVDDIGGGASGSVAERGDSASSKGGPKISAPSSTKMEISGAGTLSVGAKTMPTVIYVNSGSCLDLKIVLTVANIHLVDVGVADNGQQER